jgi:hypothetical protein
LVMAKRKLHDVQADGDGESSSEDDNDDTATAAAKEPALARPQKKKKYIHTEVIIETTTRSIRDSTKTKVEVGEINRVLNAKPKAKYRPPVIHQFSQSDLLQEALETEVLFFVINAYPIVEPLNHVACVT